MKEFDAKAEQFLKVSAQYKLGKLITEASHPGTRNLSFLASGNLPEAIVNLKSLDNDVLKVLEDSLGKLVFLKETINETLKAGRNIYFCGCGATGRLSLTIETLWRQIHHNTVLENRVFSFMSGGDVALIRSIENFEDYPQYGGRQLIESGFKDGDLLIATTEGGETPFVIGATEKAAEISLRKPFFLYCNPDNLLCEVAERSKRVIQNENIEKINLTVGPMAVTGSTRMQASTILLAVAGIALLYFDRDYHELENEIQAFRTFWEKTDLEFISPFVEKESSIYSAGEYLLYETDKYLGITVITDTTERSPTFSLYPFENIHEKDVKISLCYLYLPEYDTTVGAWRSLLWRSPRTLEWEDISGIASTHRLLGFDFSKNAFARRAVAGHVKQNSFKILDRPEGIDFDLENNAHFYNIPFSNILLKHLCLKMILNIHSTLIMGRLGRYEGNVMTFLRASNNKLIDRAIRYIEMILGSKGIIIGYNDICHVLFEMLEKTPADQSIVLATVNEIESMH